MVAQGGGCNQHPLRGNGHGGGKGNVINESAGNCRNPENHHDHDQRIPTADFADNVGQNIQNSGLLWAWPRPFEQVVIVPAADRVSERRIENLLRSDVALQADRKASFATPVSDALAGSGYLLTGDAGVVQLDVRVFYNVTEPYAFVLQGEHVLPALDRLVTRSAVALTAARDLDTILVARPELIGTDSQAAERRERLRGDLVQGINQQLAALSATGQGIGVQVVRVDVQSSLPGPAVNAFNAVLTASQHAE